MTRQMKKTLTFGILLFIIVFGAYRLFGMEMPDDRNYMISVILENDSSERWNMFKEGMKQAAEEYNVILEIYGLDEESDAYMQEEMILLLRDNHVDGVIVDCVDSVGLNEYIRDNSSILPMVLVENNICDAFSGSYISADNYEMGKKIAECMGGDASVGIISGYTRRYSNMERLDGFRENMPDNMQIQWVLQDTDQLTDYISKFPVNALVILENSMADEFIELIQNNISEYKDIDIWVIGNSNQLVYFLDKGVIKGMVVPNEFSMGYEAVESVVNIINYNHVMDSEMNYTVVTKDNMYDMDVQRIIFPIVQ